MSKEMQAVVLYTVLVALGKDLFRGVVYLGGEIFPFKGNYLGLVEAILARTQGPVVTNNAYLANALKARGLDARLMGPSGEIKTATLKPRQDVVNKRGEVVYRAGETYEIPYQPLDPVLAEARRQAREAFRALQV
ncbi:MAG: hypothetical protein KatS3mg071_1570 [Meiothermus sp.]|nr:MAG: hypothetical protein KatS3mg071_1570 [Meiothermus sp.]